MTLRPRIRDEVGVQFLGFYDILKQVLPEEYSALVYESNLHKRYLSLLSLSFASWAVLVSSPWLLQLSRGIKEMYTEGSLWGIILTLVVDSNHDMSLSWLYFCSYVLLHRMIIFVIYCKTIAILLTAITGRKTVVSSLLGTWNIFLYLFTLSISSFNVSFNELRK